jgi:transketolase
MMRESNTLEEFISGRTVVGEAILELAKNDPRIWLLTPDIGWGCKEFRDAHPERYIDTGISEQCVVGISAGLALEGNIPFIIGMMPFMSMRALEQVRSDVCYHNLPVRIIANYSGLTGNGGSTHYAMEDIALFSSLVNMTVCAPSDPNQLRQLILKSVNWNGPISIRLDPGKSNEVIYPAGTKFEIGKAHVACEGDDVTIIACGEMVGEAIKISRTLKDSGIGVRVIDMFTIKPLDTEVVLAAARETGNIITWEDHLMKNGLASAVSDVIAENCIALKSFKRFGIPDVYPGCGDPDDLYHKYGYDGEAVLSYIKKMF